MNREGPSNRVLKKNFRISDTIKYIHTIYMQLRSGILMAVGNRDQSFNDRTSTKPAIF